MTRGAGDDLSQDLAKPSTASAASGRPIARDVTLLIPTLGRDLLRDCLDSVVAGRQWPGRIIVVDQGGNEAIAGWLKDIAALGIRTRYASSSQSGRSKALNQGLRLVESRFVLITDDDCIVDEAWLATMAQRLHAHPDRVLTGRVLATGEERLLTTVLSLEPVVARRPGLYFDRLSGGNFAAPMTAFERVGLFDEDPCVAYSEDGEWAYRALKSGIEIEFVPQSIISHRGWRTLEQRIHQYERYARTRAAFFGKYLRRGDLFLAVRALLNLVRAARRWSIGKLRGDPDLAGHGAAYIRYFLPGLAQGMRSTLRAPRLELSDCAAAAEEDR